MTTLTLRVNLYDKTLVPALAGEPETIAVGETVKLRLLGLGFTATDVQAINVAIASDAVTPALRARMRHDGIGDIAIYPFPGDTPAWTTETVDGETAVCCEIDLGTAQAYGLFGGAPLPDGVHRKIRLLVERSFPNESPTLYASDTLSVGSWSFPGHELRFIGHPKGTDVSIDDVQALVSGAAAAFQSGVEAAKSGMVEEATRIAGALADISSGASGVIEALSGFRSGVVEEAIAAASSGLSGCVTISGAQTVSGHKTFVDGITLNTASGIESGLSGVDVAADGSGNLILAQDPGLSGGNTRVFIGNEDKDWDNLVVTKGMLVSGVDEAFCGLGLTYSGGYLYPRSGARGEWLMNLVASGSGYPSLTVVNDSLSQLLSALYISGYDTTPGIDTIVASLVDVVRELYDDTHDMDESFCRRVDDCVGEELSGLSGQIEAIAAIMGSSSGSGGGADPSILTRIEVLEATISGMSGGGGGGGGGGGSGGDDEGGGESGGGDDEGGGDGDGDGDDTQPPAPPFEPPLTPPDDI